ncbi:hypothetical protein QUF78_18520 [Peribacillus sp. ACCC06369]|nr:hypothetical protein [Peribacillus sp. ACCC06369]
MLSFEVKFRFSEPADLKSVQRQHMEVQTFQYDVGQFKKVKNWRLDKDGRQHKTAYEIPVTQVFNSRFGMFTCRERIRRMAFVMGSPD